MKSPLKVAVVSASNVLDTRAWSGTLNNMYTALTEQFESVVPVGPFPLSPYSKASRFIDKAMRVLTKGGFNYLHTKHRSKQLAKKIKKALEAMPHDVIFAPAGSTEIAYLETDKPICYLSDTSFGQIVNYYGKYSNFSRSAIREGNLIEQRALQNASAIIYTSQWAANYAVEHYGVEETKITLLPFGANLPEPVPLSDFSLKSVTQPWKILFLGVSWERKGGQIALDAVTALNATGHRAELTVCGCTPPITNEYMKVVPFINKKSVKGYQAFRSLLKQSHLLVLPTRAEAFGIVFCEASAFGVPSIATATGGTEGAIKNGVNGFTLSLEATGTDYAKLISKTLEDESRYNELCISSRRLYETILNWQSWASNTRELFEKLQN